MTAQTFHIDFYLIKTAAVSSTFLFLNYFLWAISAPVTIKLFALVLIIMSALFFLINKSLLAYWPIKFLIIFLALIALGSPTEGWDARSIWLFHAKRIFFDNNLYAQLDGYGTFSHNDYPVFIPSLSATLGYLIGHWNEVYPKLSSVLALCPAIYLLSSILRNTIQQLLLCSLLMLVCMGTLINGYMDGILAIYFSAASLLIYILIQQNFKLDYDSRSRLWLSLLSVAIFSILTLIKNEGLVALLVLLVASILLWIFIKEIKITVTSLIILLIAIIPIMLWKIMCIKNGITNDLAGSNLILQLTNRIYSIDNYLQIFRSILSHKVTLIPLLLFVFALFKSKNRNFILYISLCALLYLLVLFIVYLSTPMDLTWHLSTSVRRTILPIGLILGYSFIATFRISSLSALKKEIKV